MFLTCRTSGSRTNRLYLNKFTRKLFKSTSLHAFNIKRTEIKPKKKIGREKRH